MKQYSDYQLTKDQREGLVAGSGWTKVPLECFTDSKQKDNKMKPVIDEDFDKLMAEQARKRWVFKNAMISGILTFLYFFIIAACNSLYDFHPLYFGGFLLPVLAVLLVGTWSK